MRQLLIAILICMVPSVGFAAEETDSTIGIGWTMQRLDLRVRVEKDDPGLTVVGTMVLRLDKEFSPGPTLWMNSNVTAMQWKSVEGAEVASVDLNVTSEHSSPVLIGEWCLTPIKESLS